MSGYRGANQLFVSPDEVLAGMDGSCSVGSSLRQPSFLCAKASATTALLPSTLSEHSPA